MHHLPDACNRRCNSSSEQSGPASSKMKRHRHSTVLEWHAPSSIVSYMHLYGPELLAQQRHVVNVSETIGHRGAVTSANREASHQRHKTVADDASLYDVRVDVDGIEPLVHVHRRSLFWVSK